MPMSSLRSLKTGATFLSTAETDVDLSDTQETDAGFNGVLGYGAGPSGTRKSDDGFNWGLGIDVIFSDG